MQSENLGPVGSRVVVFLDLRGMGASDGDFDGELAELAFELWEAAGVLLRAISPAGLVELEVDLAEWDERGPDPDMLGGR
jgi:hypothetical protein